MKRPSSPSAFATPKKRYRLQSSSPIFHTPLSTHSSLYRTPADSPTNPFGRTLPKDPELPPITSFARHLPLRFQVVSEHVPDVHRIVQVPLNYTFTHLRALITWLFDTTPCGEKGHLFRAHKGSAPYKLGVFKPGSGNLIAKLSSVRDPYTRLQTRKIRRSRSRSSCSRPTSGEFTLDDLRKGSTWDSEYAFDAPDTDNASEASLRIYHDGGPEGEDGEEEEELEEDLEQEPADEGDDWRWEAEETYTLLHVFPYGGDQQAGIIYEPPSGKYEIHISLNSIKIPSRRGRSNEPHVFLAAGHIQDDDAYLAPDSDDGAQPLVEPINPSYWNERRPFTSFLPTYYARLRAYDEDGELLPESERPVARALFPSSATSLSFLPTPPNTNPSREGLLSSSPSSTSSPLPLASSSPAKSACTHTSSRSSSYNLSFLFPAETPLPKHKLLRKRLDKATSWIKKHIKVEKEIMKSERKEHRKATGKDLDKDSSEGSSEDEGGLQSDDEKKVEEDEIWGDDIELCPPDPILQGRAGVVEEEVAEVVDEREEAEEEVDELSSDVETDGGDGWRSWDD